MLIANEKKIKKIVNSNIIILLLGQLVSLFGSSIYSFAMSLYILQATSSALNFSLTLALSTIPKVIMGPISGVISDKVDRKKMIVIMDILSGIAILSLFTVSYFDELRLIYVYIATVILSICNTFFDTPLQASIPNIVDDNNIAKVNSLSQSVRAITQIAGPFVGGLIFTVIDIKLFLLLNGLSFVFSGISEMFINFKVRVMIEGKIGEIKDVSNKKTGFFKDLIEGLQYIKSQKWLIVIFIFAVFINLFLMMGLTVPVPYIVNELWGFSSKQYGALVTIFPIGMLVGSLILSLVPQAEKNYKRIVIGSLVFGISILSVGILVSEALFTLNNIQYLIILMIIHFSIAIACMFINIPLHVTIQKLIPDDKRGRVFGIMTTLVMGLSPIGAIIAGALMDVIPPYILPISCGAILVIMTILMSRTEGLKNI
jgi:MFS family permease